MATALVQSRSGVGTGTSLAVVYNSNNTAGNFLICTTSSTQTRSIATDNNSNTWAAGANDNSAGNKARVDYVQSCNAGACTVTGHTGASDSIYVHIREVSGVASSSPVRDSGTNTGATTTATVSTAGSTTQTGDFCLAQFYDNNAAGTWTAIAPYADGLTGDSGNGDHCGTESLVATGAGTQTATMTNSHASGAYSGLIVTFALALATSATTVPQYDMPTAGPSFAI